MVDLHTMIEQSTYAIELALSLGDTDPGVVSLPGNEWIELAEAAEDYAEILMNCAERLTKVCARNHYGSTVEGEDVHQMLFDRLRGPDASFRADVLSHATFLRQYAQACRDADKVLREADGE